MLKFQKNSKDEGFILAATISIAFAITIIVSSIILLTITETQLSARNDSLNISRETSENLSNEMFSQLIRDQRNFDNLITSWNGNSPSKGWKKYSSTNGWIDCGSRDYFILCARVAKIQPAITSDTLLGTKRVEFILDIVTRSKCSHLPPTGQSGDCIYTRSQVKIRERQFFDNLILSESELLAPVNYPTIGIYSSSWAYSHCDLQSGNLTDEKDCLYSQYQSISTQDKINGPIHTNDAHIYICSSSKAVVFNDRVSSVPGNNGSVFAVRNPDVCQNKVSVRANKIISVDKPLRLPKEASGLKTIATADGAFFDTPNTSQTIVLGGDNNNPQYTISNVTKSYPTNGVLYFTGDVNISGTVFGKLTIYSDKTIHITNNITYNNLSTDILGLIAKNNITISCTARTKCPNRTVNAVLLALTGMIGNENWDNSPVTGTAPNLTFFGSMSSYYRGVFGSINSVSGVFENGWVKNFEYDPKLKNTQPPNFLRPVNTSWEKVGYVELSCDNTCWSSSWDSFRTQ